MGACSSQPAPLGARWAGILVWWKAQWECSHAAKVKRSLVLGGGQMKDPWEEEAAQWLLLCR